MRQVQGMGEEGKERVFQSQETASTKAQRQAEIECFAPCLGLFLQLSTTPENLVSCNSSYFAYELVFWMGFCGDTSSLLCLASSGTAQRMG